MRAFLEGANKWHNNEQQHFGKITLKPGSKVA
jgi:hypothetical protein